MPVELGAVLALAAATEATTEQWHAANLTSGMLVVLHDPVRHVGAVASVLLPDSELAGSLEDEPAGKYADTAIPALIEAFLTRGGQKQNTVATLVGGSQLFNFGGGGNNALNVGTRNAIVLRTYLSKEGVTVGKSHTGGNKKRDVDVDVYSGTITVQLAGQEPLIL